MVVPEPNCSELPAKVRAGCHYLCSCSQVDGHAGSEMGIVGGERYKRLQSRSVFVCDGSSC